MARGDIHRGESGTFSDAGTGASIRQVTAHPSIHHHPFHCVPAHDDGMRRLLLVSHRTGAPQLFAELRDEGVLVQLTERGGLSEWSFHPSHDGRFVYYTAADGLWRVECETQREERLLSFTGIDGVEARAAAAGISALSRDDRWWAVAVSAEEGSPAGRRVDHLVVVDTCSGRHETVLRKEKGRISQPQFHPGDSGLLRYAGSHRDRLRVVNRDGSGDRLAYERRGNEWIVHECWMPDRRELLSARWPHGVIGVDVDSGAVRTVCRFNAWHPMIDRGGDRMVSDTTFPDRGLMLFDPNDGAGEPRLLCESGSNNVGPHWDTDHCPYDDEDFIQGKWKVRSLQHTHPHPSFSPDGRLVVFTSDRTGHSQVYEVEVRARSASNPGGTPALFPHHT